MARFNNTIRCDGCGVEILLSPVVANKLEYCCLDCSQGFECNCGAEVEFEEREPGSENSIIERIDILEE